MQSSSSTSIIRHFSSFLRRTKISYHGSGLGITTRRSFYFLANKRDNPPTLHQPSKIFLRTLIEPVLAFDVKPSLSKSDAIGTVAAAQADLMRVIVTKDGEDCSSKSYVELVCVVKALLKKIQRKVLVGDKVLVGHINWLDQRGMIENLFERQTEILDPSVANVDHLLVFFSLDQPKLEPYTLTRFLVEAESTGIPITLALNKCELITQEEMELWRMRLRGWNYKPLFCSVETKVGIDAIEMNLRGQTSVIVGPSGVGKSTLINELRSRSASAIEKEKGFKPELGIKWFETSAETEERQKDDLGPKFKRSKKNKQKKKKWHDDQSVGEVSASNSKGQHTTRNVSLLPVCGGGYLADTPGCNKHKLLKVTKELLPLCFPEIRKMIDGRKCFFHGSSYIGVEGCIVKDDWERYPYYLKLLDDIKAEEESQLKKYGTKKEGNVRYSKVGGMGEKKVVPRLDPKKYKRESRKTMKQRTMAELDD